MGDKEDKLSTIVLKVDDMQHCEGCALKIKNSVKGLRGVVGATIDRTNSTLTVVGKVDPWAVRERVEKKTHKKVEFVSPTNPAKKEADGGGKKKAAAVEQEKPKQVHLDCDGCVETVKKTLQKVQGVHDVTVDAEGELVTVRGTMDVEPLPGYLQEKLKRAVELVSKKK